MVLICEGAVAKSFRFGDAMSRINKCYRNFLRRIDKTDTHIYQNAAIIHTNITLLFSCTVRSIQNVDVDRTLTSPLIFIPMKECRDRIR